MFRNHDPLYFHDPRPGHPHFEFSNSSPHAVRFEGHIYPTATHLYHARKFLGLHSGIAARIRRAPTVSDVLREAQVYHTYRRSDWDQVYFDVMEEVVEAKFIQHPSLLQKLRSTGNRELVDADPNDGFWGMGPWGVGKNELGKAMMRVRHRLREF